MINSLKCPMCGKVFTPNTNPECGAVINGEPHCDEKQLTLELCELQPERKGTNHAE